MLQWNEVVSARADVLGGPIAWVPRIHRHTAVLVGRLGPYLVYSEVSARWVRETDLTRRIRARLAQPRRVVPIPA
jgi:hypothetical protein